MHLNFACILAHRRAKQRRHCNRSPHCCTASLADVFPPFLMNGGYFGWSSRNSPIYWNYTIYVKGVQWWILTVFTLFFYAFRSFQTNRDGFVQFHAVRRHRAFQCQHLNACPGCLPQRLRKFRIGRIIGMQRLHIRHLDHE